MTTTWRQVGEPEETSSDAQFAVIGSRSTSANQADEQLDVCFATLGYAGPRAKLVD